MTSKQDRKCMANKSIDRRVALKLNSWQSGALGKLWGSAWPEWDTKRYWIRDIEPAEPLIPTWSAAQSYMSGQSSFTLQLILFSFLCVELKWNLFNLNSNFGFSGHDYQTHQNSCVVSGCFWRLLSILCACAVLRHISVQMVGSGNKHCREKHIYCISDVSLLYVLLELMHSDTLWLTIRRPSYSDKSAGLRFCTTCKLQKDGGLWFSFKQQDSDSEKPRSTGKILWFWLNDNKAVDGAWHHFRLLCVQQSFFCFKDRI